MGSQLPSSRVRDEPEEVRLPGRFQSRGKRSLNAERTDGDAFRIVGYSVESAVWPILSDNSIDATRIGGSSGFCETEQTNY